VIEPALLDRPRCVLTGAADLEPVCELKRFPVHMGCVDQAPADDLFADMRWMQSASSGSLQLDPLVPLELVYLGAHNATIGGTWHAHHEAFARFLRAAEPRAVLEFGGADGYLATTVAETVPGLDWTIIDPNPTVEERPGLRVRRGLVEPGLALPDDVDVIVHSHFIEHVYEPRLLLASIVEGARPGTRMIFSAPSMLDQLRQGYANALNFEHTVFLRHEYVAYLLEATGFELLRTERFRDHSIFFDAVVRGAPDVAPEIPDVAAENRKLLTAFVDSMAADARDLAARAQAWPGPVYLFGAHVFAQFLLNAGLPEAGLAGVLDNNPAKHGRRLYGTGLLVDPPSVLAGGRDIAVILRAAHYNEEIRRQIHTEINGDVEFW
jgi:SAM-dependent methyltransferase